MRVYFCTTGTRAAGTLAFDIGLLQQLHTAMTRDCLAQTRDTCSRSLTRSSTPTAHTHAHTYENTAVELPLHSTSTLQYKTTAQRVNTLEKVAITKQKQNY